MKNSFLILLCLVFTWQAKAQAPQYSHYIAPTDTNMANLFMIDFPNYTGVNISQNAFQCVYNSNDFPGMPQHGQITAVYIRLQSLGKSVYIDSFITIKNLTVKIKAFPNDSFTINQQPETGLTTVFFDSSYQFTNDSTTDPANFLYKWLKLPLANPYTYNFDDNEDRKGNLLVEISGEVPSYHVHITNGNTIFYHTISIYKINNDTIPIYYRYRLQTLKYSLSNPQSIQFQGAKLFIGFDTQPLASVSEVRNGAAGAVYPNPVRERLYFQSSLQGATFTLYNLSGIKVMSGKASASGVLVSGLPKGMYLLQAGGEMWKVVKE